MQRCGVRNGAVMVRHVLPAALPPGTPPNRRRRSADRRATRRAGTATAVRSGEGLTMGTPRSPLKVERPVCNGHSLCPLPRCFGSPFVALLRRPHFPTLIGSTRDGHKASAPEMIDRTADKLLVCVPNYIKVYIYFDIIYIFFMCVYRYITYVNPVTGGSCAATGRSIGVPVLSWRWPPGPLVPGREGGSNSADAEDEEEDCRWKDEDEEEEEKEDEGGEGEGDGDVEGPPWVDSGGPVCCPTRGWLVRCFD